MKKMLKTGLSFLTCVALLLTILLSAPLRSLAADSPQEHFSLRVEGLHGMVYSGQVAFDDGQYLYPVLKSFLGTHSIPETDTDSPEYGHNIVSIGDNNLASGENEPDGSVSDGSEYNSACWWGIYANGAMSDGVDLVKLEDGAKIEFFYAGSDSLYPQVKIQPQNPVAGQSVTVNVSADATDWSTGSPVTTHENVKDADVTFDGAAQGKTGSDGSITFTAPAQAGTYSLSVSEEHSSDFPNDDYPLLMRTGDIPVTVGTAPTQPTGGDFNMTNNSVSFNVIDDNGGKSAILPQAGFTANSLDAYSNSYNLAIPGGTTISGPASWDGTFTTPTVVSASALNVAGGDIRLVVEAGDPGESLTLSNFAKLTLPLQSGKKAGYFDASGTFHDMPKLSANAAPSSGDDGYYDDTVNNALIIYTKHFTKFVAYVPAANITVTDSLVKSAVSGAGAFLQKNDSSDWTAFALNRAGFPVPSGYLAGVAQALKDNGGDFGGAASLAKTVIALRAAGANPASFNGYNLLEKLYNYKGLETAGLNGPLYSLLALDSGKYQVPSSALWNDQKLVSSILGSQNHDGSFALTKGLAGDPDITAMAVTALAPHLTESGVAAAVDKAVGFLSSAQAADGGFVPSGSSQEASESTSQVIIALSSTGVDPLTDSRFIKNGKSLLDNLMSYKNSDGAFKHIKAGGSDIIATQQALMALDAYTRYEQHSPRLYDLSASAATVTSVAVPNPQTGSPDMTPVWVVSAFMLALLAASGLKRRKKGGIRQDIR
jgi:hypothetical protein